MLFCILIPTCFYFLEAQDLRRLVSLDPPTGQRGDELEQQLPHHDLDGFAKVKLILNCLKL